MQSVFKPLFAALALIGAPGTSARAEQFDGSYSDDGRYIEVGASADRHAVAMLETPDGGIVQVFPNTHAKSNRLKGDSTTSLPPKNALTKAGGPAGVDHLLVIVSTHPRQFKALGMKNIDGFEQTTLDAARQAAEAAGASASVFAGTPVCTPPCSDEYGATVFTVEEVK